MVRPFYESYEEDPLRPTIFDNFRTTAQLYPDRPCLGTREYLPDGSRGEFSFINYRETAQWVDDVCHAIHSTGLCNIDRETPTPIPHINVGIIGSNSASWVVTDLACQKLGLVTVPIYSSLKQSEILTVAKDAELSAIAVNEENFKFAVDQLLNHVRPFKDPLAGSEEVCRLLIFMVDTPEVSDEIKIQLRALMDFGIRILIVQQPTIFSDSNSRDFCPICTKLDSNNPVCDPESPCTIIYTSGSTGTPKGAVLSHTNLMAALFGFRTNLPASNIMLNENFTGEESDKHPKVLSYLPLEHVLGRQIPWLNFLMGGSVCFWSRNPKTLAEDIKYCRPSYFVGVPRVFHRIINSVFEKVENSNFLVRKLFRMGLRSKLSSFESDGSFVSPFWDKLVFSKIAQALGGNVRSIISGSAPLGASTATLVRVLFSCPLTEGYGSTETAASITAQTLNEKSVGNVGVALVPKNGLRIDPLAYLDDSQPSLSKSAKGEILVKGITVFQGYYNAPEATKGIIDDQGWLHTGDVGSIDSNGQLHILDRVGNIFKLANGLFVSPESIESAFAKCTLVSPIWVTGSSSLRYPVAVVWPTDDLSPGWTSMKEEERERYLVEHDDEMTVKVLKSFQELGRAEGLNGYEIPSRILIATNDPTPQSGLLTPTLKPRRGILKKHFKNELDGLFSEEQKELSVGAKDFSKSQGESYPEPNPLFACLPNLRTIPSFAELQAYVEQIKLPEINFNVNVFNKFRRPSKDEGYRSDEVGQGRNEVDQAIDNGK
ncbi:hypothetical protein P9112_002724 [Eukaryota sp. TZLM1-RC]